MKVSAVITIWAALLFSLAIFSNAGPGQAASAQDGMCFKPALAQASPVCSGTTSRIAVLVNTSYDKTDMTGQREDGVV